MSAARSELFTFRVVFVLSELGDSLLIKNHSEFGSVLGEWSPRRGLSTTEGGRWLAADRDVEHRVVHLCVKIWTGERDKLERERNARLLSEHEEKCKAQDARAEAKL